jgi:dienelactone hydrolase
VARWKQVVVVGCVTFATLAACADEAKDSELGIADPAFYVAPDPFPEGRPGDILRVESVDGFGGDGELFRVLYRSESLAGDPIAVSGVIAVPPGEPPEGGWPVLSLAHGTVGLADACAPSRNPGRQAAEVASNGYVVVGTDYEGLGTAGRHPYLVGESEGRGVIDAVRAARALGDRVEASSRYAIIGYSQGGHAALFANQIAASWAPELTLVGTVAGAPAAELDAWLGYLGPEWDWLRVMVAAGLQAAEPAADPALLLTPSGQERLPIVDEGCSNEVLAGFAEGGALSADLRRTPPFDQLLAANTPGQVAGAAPVFLLGGDADPLIPPWLLDAAQARLCASGQVVERRTYPGANHDTIGTASLVDAGIWAQDRFAGKAVANACP